MVWDFFYLGFIRVKVIYFLLEMNFGGRLVYNFFMFDGFGGRNVYF